MSPCKSASTANSVRVAASVSVPPRDRMPSPAPADAHDVLGIDKSADAGAIRRAYRAACLRWHPDRFVQAWGGLLAADERDAVLQRVTEVSQAINALNQAQPD